MTHLQIKLKAKNESLNKKNHVWMFFSILNENEAKVDYEE